MIDRIAPALFVALWATGFVVARLVRPYAEPESFVALRFVLSAVVLAFAAAASGAPWPRTFRGWRDGLVAGVLMQGVYLGGVFWAVKNGLPAAVAALISGLQPLLTGALARPLLGEHVGSRRWAGIVVGFVGALLVLEPAVHDKLGVPPVAIAVCTIAMTAITVGTLWQKRFGSAVDLRVGATIQFVGGAAVVLPFAAAETRHFTFSVELVVGINWAVLVLSVAANLLLLRLLKAGAVAQVTSLFYLVPPITAVMSLLLFGERLYLIQILGMGVTIVGVALAGKTARVRAVAVGRAA